MGSVFASACWTPKKRAAAPPPPQPAVQLPLDVTPPQRIDTPPEIVAPELPQPAPSRLPDLPRVQPEATPSRVRRNGATAAQPPAVAEQPAQPPAVVGPPPPTPAPTPPVEVPELAPMLTPDEQRAYDAVTGEMIARTQQNIGLARSRRLNDQQKDLVVRAEGFLEQASKMRRKDPAAAKSLAERAELLSREAIRQ